MTMYTDRQHTKRISQRPILIIEDDEADQLFIQEALSMFGVKNPVLMLNNGMEASEYLFPNVESLKLPCLIILDLGLPDVRGVDLLGQLRENPITRPIPVVIMTNSSQPEDVFKCYATGASSFIRKSPNPAEFREAMRLLVTYWLDVCQLPS